MAASSRTLGALSGCRRYILSIAVFGSLTLPAAAQTDNPVLALPSGPKDLLSQFSTDPAEIGDIVRSQRSTEEWSAYLARSGPTMTEGELAILAEYLALNVPFAVTGADVPSMVDSLPMDGRELFAANCLSCHGAASYYLLQDRDAAGWLDIFAAPYHRRLLTEENERETFSSYAVHAMPIAEGDIPEAWRE